MARNGSGVYSRPAGTVAVPNTTIESAKFEALVTDIINDLNVPRPISAGGTGSTTAADARTALGISATNTPFTPTGDIAATNVQTAIAELDSEKAATTTLASYAALAGATFVGGISGTTASFSGVVSGANASADGHLLNRITADGRFAPAASAIAGEVLFVAQNTAPTGTLKANGAAVSRTTYAALFSAIGTTYGAGDGSTTFNLPDLRGEFVRGWDDGRGIDSGRVFGSTQDDAFQGHFHDSNTVSAAFNVAAGATSVIRPSGDFATQGPVTDGTNGTPRTAAETRPRNIALLAVIRF